LGGSNTWRQPLTGEDWMREVEKRILHEERRPNIQTAADLLGPGIAPFSIWVQDWNAPETAFNGLFHSEPGAFNVPSNTRYWMGTSQATNEGYGLQRVSEYRGYSSDVLWPRPTYLRKFFTTSGAQRQFSAWRVEDNTPVGMLGEFAGSNIFVPPFSTSSNATAWTAATGWSIARQETRYVAAGLLHTDVELLRTGAAINVGTTGDVANVLVATLSSTYTLLSGQNSLSSGQVGRTAHFNVYSSNRELSLTSLGGSVALAVNEDLSFGGVIPVRAATNATAPTAPNGWLVCNGSLRDIVDYPDLFGVIGTSYNIGAEPGGQFRLPNISGKVIKA
jgi:hypothetical protein